MSNHTTGALRSEHDYQRQLAFLDQAEKNGHTVIRGETDAEKRRLGISLVIMKNGLGEGEGGLMEEEIFGPVLPIIPVDVGEPLMDPEVGAEGGSRWMRRLISSMLDQSR